MIPNLKKLIDIFLESFIYLLIIWISFFPVTIHQKFHFAVKVFLMLAFVFLLVKRGASIFKRTDLTLWLFIICIGTNLLFTRHKDIAFKAYLDLAIPMLSIYYLISRNFSFGSPFNSLAKTICVFSALVALSGILESFFAYNPIYEYLIRNPYYERFARGSIDFSSTDALPRFHIRGILSPMSTQFHPVILGSYLLYCLPFNFLVYKQNKSLFKLLGAISLIFSIPVLLITFTREVFFGLVAIVIFYLFVKKRYKLIWIFLAFLLIFILACTYLPHPFDRYGLSIMSKEDDGIFSTYRLARCAMSKYIIKEHPFIGIGLQHFRIRFYEYYPRKDGVPYEFRIIDNMYLTLLSETGIIGFAGFLIFILSFFRKGWRRFKRLDPALQEKRQLLVVLTAFLGLLVNMTGYDLLYWPGLYLLFCIIIGMLGIDYKIRTIK